MLNPEFLRAQSQDESQKNIICAHNQQGSVEIKIVPIGFKPRTCWPRKDDRLRGISMYYSRRMQPTQRVKAPAIGRIQVELCRLVARASQKRKKIENQIRESLCSRKRRLQSADGAQNDASCADVNADLQ